MGDRGEPSPTNIEGFVVVFSGGEQSCKLNSLLDGRNPELQQEPCATEFDYVRAGHDNNDI